MAISGKIILIIDDDIEIVKLLTKIFEALGIIIHSAQNLTEAKKILYNTIPHLIFLDIKLGTENGLDYISFLKSLPFCKSLPVIIFSSVNDKEILEEAWRCRPADIIKKPIVANTLIQKVRKYIKESSTNNVIFSDFQELPQVFSINGKISKMNQHFMEVNSDVKIANATYLKVKAPLMDRIGFTDAKFLSGGFVKEIEGGSYCNKLYYIGASDKTLKTIKELRLK